MFQRDDSPFTSSTRERAKALKVKVELHYNQSVGYAVERNQRYVKRLWPYALLPRVGFFFTLGEANGGMSQTRGARAGT